MTGQLEPEMLADGAILAPVTQPDGQQAMVRLEPGEDEHAAWVAYMQRQRTGGAPPPPPPPPSDRPVWEHGQPFAPARPMRRAPSTWGVALIVIAVILGGLWFSGSLDGPLSSVGLNKNPCLKNAFGATFCGDDAKSYCSSLSDLRKLSDQPTACDEIEGR